jgi:hypothetical protein
MDLNYWIDYVYTFGVAHKIPAYDHMSFFYYHNMDIWLILIAVISLFMMAFKSLLETFSGLEDDK